METVILIPFFYILQLSWKYNNEYLWLGSSLPVTTLGRYESQLTKLAANNLTTSSSGRSTYRTLPKVNKK